MSQKRKLISIGSVLVIAMLACQGSANPAPSAETGPTIRVETLPPDDPLMSTDVPGAVSAGELGLPSNFLEDPNTACAIHSDVRGLTCLNRDGWQRYEFDSPSLIVPCSDGRTYLCIGDNLYLHKDGTILEIGKPDTYFGYAGALACGPGGEFWVRSDAWLFRYDGAAWTEYAASRYLGYEPYQTHKEIMVAPNGNLWVIARGKIATFDGTDWQVFEKGHGFEEDIYPLDLVPDADGNVWSLSQGCSGISCSGGNPYVTSISPGRLLKYDGAGWTVFPLPDGLYESFIRLDHKGRIWVVRFGLPSVTFYAFDPQMTDWVLQYAAEGFSRRAIRDLQVDGQDRLWVATDYGLDIYDGSNWTTYRMDTADLYANDVDEVMVFGNGPQLPDLVSKAPGSVRGRVVDPTSMTSYAGLQVEICIMRAFSVLTGDTPCDDQLYHAVTTMDAEGNFLFTDIPVGKYYLMIQISSDSWARMVEASPTASILGAQFEVEPGSEAQLGDITASADGK